LIASVEDAFKDGEDFMELYGTDDDTDEQQNRRHRPRSNGKVALKVYRERMKKEIIMLESAKRLSPQTQTSLWGDWQSINKIMMQKFGLFSRK
jgi:hypothetical protein